MSRYIDSEKLIAEIELLLKRNEPYCGNAVADGQRQALYHMKDFITSIQQEQDHFADASKMGPEVDLEKEYKSYIKSKKDNLSGNAVTINMKDLARHFYELGLNAGEK